MSKDIWPRFLRPSTRAFIKEARQTPGYSLFDWLHGYVYARWPYLYIGIGVGEHPLARLLAPLADKVSKLWPPETTAESPAGLSSPPSARESERITFADTYHGKVVPLAAAKGLVTVNEEIRLTNLEQIIPYPCARDIILHNPDHIVVLQCPCRTARANPCEPLDVCLIVGEPLAGFVAEHHPTRSRWITPEEAVDILQAEDERGHVHHAFFKDAMLGRFYALCNCCACCCGAMQAQRHNVPMLAASGYVSRVNETLCQGCGECTPYCQFEALTIVDNGTAVVDTRRCMGCGICLSKCSRAAISLERDASKGEPLEIHQLMAAASQTVIR